MADQSEREAGETARGASGNQLMTNKQHTNSNLEADLRTLSEQILAMGHLVEAHVGAAVRSLVRQDVKLAKRLVEADRAVNQMELAVDEQCIRVLALYQPEASDLRFVASAIKMVTDLERIGDLAVDMTECVRSGAEQSAVAAEAAMIPALAEQAQKMLRDVLDAFVRRDAIKAERIIADRAQFAEPVERLCAEVTSEMESAPKAIEQGVGLLFFAKRIKRVADHVANIAEMVVYEVSGRDVRHASSL
jgi:phosphate transport system protein